MTTISSDRTGILIVRLWVEQNGHDRFRARISQTLDASLHEQTSAMAASAEDLYAAVRTWVEAFVDPS